MSGTSHDGIDAAVVDFRMRGDTVHGHVTATASTPYDADLRTRIRAALPPAATTLEQVCALDTLIGQAFADAAVLTTGVHPAGFDVDGALAARGRVHEALLTDLLAEPFYRLPPPKSAGKQLFHPGYLAGVLAPPTEPADLIATLTALTARTVADAVRGADLDTLVVSGGGAANPTLLRMLTDQLPGVRLVPSAQLGAPGQAKEAIAFALIGGKTLHGLPATVPTATGARGPRVLGSITPGAGPLTLPAALSTAPSALRLTVAEGVG